ncbi:hypothetical protein FH947_001898 [Enterococcus faecalis]|uniref:hypothetical protein n=1 Tax=Enterococcus faecalis TaxID=1351 RepID=UPI001A076ECB|nr:hypothetical protein [Enterococcus faecalis]EGO7832330.1 hypothetical protein [Enterococcus faecalis]EGO8121900.1 hypothetical protein [Enterococcus faecalis]EKK0978275.1 hypothetical protein [Enterococcus faecalis]EKZ0164245.1 hypothetical protein [Enterococcus faecalis]EKZ0220912.1 hypothetical protein [Enterococcus faecalis]
MNQEQLEMKLEHKTLEIEEMSRFCATVLQNLCDEGSTITHEESDKCLSKISEKLDFVINELTDTKKDVDLIESVENWLYSE